MTMTVEDIIMERGIKEVVHFTTNHGLLGILSSRALKSRARLPAEERLKFIYAPNAMVRRDAKWFDYVNLSISKINRPFFRICSERWHIGKDIWWCLIALSEEIMTHEGVYFSTTNNMYTGARRKKGAEGLSQLFKPQILRYQRNIANRHANIPPHMPTCEQAEVLYPEEVATSFMKAIYVKKEEHADKIQGKLAITGHPAVEVIVDASKFQ